VLGQNDDGVELGAKQGSKEKKDDEALECDGSREGLLHGVDYSGVAYRCF